MSINKFQIDRFVPWKNKEVKKPRRAFTVGESGSMSNQEPDLAVTQQIDKTPCLPRVFRAFEEPEYVITKQIGKKPFVTKPFQLSKESRMDLPWALKESEWIDSKERQYWHDHDLKKRLLRKYEDTYFPQVEVLVNHWNIMSDEKKRKIKEQYILLKKGNALNKVKYHEQKSKSETEIASSSSSISIAETPESIRYRWKDLWQVARAETVSDKVRDTERILELENHEKKQYMIENHPWSCQCDNDALCSCLHQRLRKSLENNTATDRSFSKLPDDFKSYLLLHAISEHEQDNGDDDDDDDDDDDSTLESGMVGESLWTAAEKRRFFIALDRCGRHDITEIAKRVGPTKTIQEVIVYLNILKTLSKANPMEEGKLDKLFKIDSNFTAREMSPFFIMQEEHMADKIIQKFETESFEKHIELITLGRDIYKKPLEFFELWNMSSLTRLFVGTDDMTVLSSAIVQYYELIRYFLHDIITIIYTEMTNETSRTVTKKRMNRVLAKRRHVWRSLFAEKQDTRLKNMDVMGAIDRKRSFHEVFERNKSASFLAKKRQRRWIVKNQITTNDNSQNNLNEERHIPDESLSNIPIELSDTEEEEFSDESNGFDEDDTLEGSFYRIVDSDSEDELDQRFGPYESQLYIEQATEISDKAGDDEIESQLMQLDKNYEKKLSKKLGFVISS